ncbi:hypothetical protein, partial [Mycobacterium avium]|uniref:hypothetical protein n=1 Tax=Mycobacterium avium TaxID=1764 RepID=UPI001F2B9948
PAAILSPMTRGAERAKGAMERSIRRFCERRRVCVWQTIRVSSPRGRRFAAKNCAAARRLFPIPARRRLTTAQCNQVAIKASEGERG